MRRRDFVIAGAGAFGAKPPRAAAAVAGHSLLGDDPGRSPIDLWGWETTPFYQRAALASPAFVTRRAIDESFRRGANLVELYRGGFPVENREGWTQDSTAALHRHLHELDMVVHWFPHRLDAAGPAEAQAIGHWAPPQDPSNSFAGSMELVRAIGRDHFDALGVAPEALLDGLGTEQWPTLPAALFNKAMWPYLPGAYFYTDNHAFADTLPNEIEVTASNGFGCDDQTTGYHQLRAELRKRHGLQFWASQAECRTRVPANAFGGLGHPDWVLKQMNDQFRLRLRQSGRMLSPSALWWINESEDVCPEENRRYVYGVSQDPVRCAVSATFRALGGEGAATSKGRRAAQRYPYPAGAAFLQNNYLRAVCLPDRDASTLRADPERLAHYDGDSAAVTLLDPLVETRGAAARSVRFEHPEPAGYRAVLRQHLQMDACEEIRTFTAESDTPYLRLKVERTARNGAPALTTAIGAGLYDRLQAEPAGAAVPDRLLLSDSAGRHPDVAVLVLARGGLTGFRFRAHRELELLAASGAHAFEIAFALPRGLYEGDALGHLREFLARPEERVALDAAGACVVENRAPIPVVKVVRVSGAGEKPYQIHEFGRWAFRGAQPSLLHPGEDYVKCYLPAGGSARLQRYGWMDGVARPGWGCQHTIAISDCRRRDGAVALTARVRDVTAFLFAPRIRLRGPLASVRVDGRPWRYFDGAHVFLPNRPGRYRVEVEEGAAAGPHLARTGAHIESCELSGATLRFEARLPIWVESTPEGFWFSALIRHPGRKLTGLRGATLVRGKEREASIVSFTPGAVEATFDGPGEAPRFHLDADVARHFAAQSVTMLEPYLDGLETEVLDMAAVTPGALGRFGSMVWSQYFREALPAAFPAATLRDWVAGGGGLVLLTNALRALPLLLGRELGAMRTLYVNHRAFRQHTDAGVTPLVPEHPLFAGLTARGGNVSLAPPQSFDIFQRVDWATDLPALGRLWIDPPAGATPDEAIFAAAPTLWEIRLGRGRIVAYACGLRYNLGSPDRWTPNATAVRFIQNAIRRAGAGRTAVLRGA